MRSSRIVLFIALFVMVAAGAQAAVPAWKAEFEEICAHTSNATELSKAELTSLIDRCRKLEPALEKLDATEKKVYKKRLQMCRELYEYVLRSKEAAEAPPAKP